MTAEEFEYISSIDREIKELKQALEFIEGTNKYYPPVDELDSPFYVDLTYNNGARRQFLGKYIQITLPKSELLRSELKHLESKFNSIRVKI